MEALDKVRVGGVGRPRPGPGPVPGKRYAGGPTVNDDDVVENNSDDDSNKDDDGDDNDATGSKAAQREEEEIEAELDRRVFEFLISSIKQKVVYNIYWNLLVYIYLLFLFFS